MGLSHQLGVFWSAQKVREVDHGIAAGERVQRSVAGLQNRQATHLPHSHLFHLEREWCVETLVRSQHMQI